MRCFVDLPVKVYAKLQSKCCTGASVIKFLLGTKFSFVQGTWRLSLCPLNAQFLRKHEISHAYKNRSKLLVILNYSYQRSHYSKETDYKRPLLLKIYLTVRTVHQYMPKMHKILSIN